MQCTARARCYLCTAMGLSRLTQRCFTGFSATKSFLFTGSYDTYDCVCAGRLVTLHTRYFRLIAPA